MQRKLLGIMKFVPRFFFCEFKSLFSGEADEIIFNLNPNITQNDSGALQQNKSLSDLMGITWLKV